MRFATLVAAVIGSTPAFAYELQLDASGSPQRVDGAVQYAVNQNGSQDVDVAGIEALYAAAPTAQEQATGCATASGPASNALILFLAAALFRRLSRAARPSPR